MATLAIHVKFALDTKSNYQIQDLPKFISGAIYPDSRYVSGIKRRLTHDKNLLAGLNKNDFEKGWSTHIICDELWHELVYKKFPELNPEVAGLTQNWWSAISAVKIIQGELVLKKFDIRPFIKFLDYQTPYGEPIEIIRTYYQDLKKIYGKRPFTRENSLMMCAALGIENESINLIRDKMEKFSADGKIMEKINSLYPEMLKEAKI